MASVTPEVVRNRINLSSSDIDDSTVTEFIVDACAEVEIETGRTINYSSCLQAEAAAITNLAAIYCLVHISGGVASGLSYKIGSLSVSEASSEPSLSEKAETLYREAQRLMERLRKPYLGRV